MMRVTSGKVVARILAGVLAFSLLGQNVTTVYAVAPATEQTSVDPEQKGEIVTEPEQEEENTAPQEQEEKPDPENSGNEGTEPDEKDEEVDEPKDSDDDGNVDDPDESGDIDDAEDVTDPDGEDTDPVDPDGTITSPEEDLEAAPTAPITIEEVNETTVATIGDQGYETLQDAIDAAEDGDTITLLKDTNENIKASCYHKEGLSSFTLDLNGYTIDGKRSGRVIELNAQNGKDIVIKNGTIKNGYVANNGTGGAGIYIDGNSTLTLDNLTIMDCEAHYGGGLYILGSTNLIIKNSTIKDNLASGCGAGINLSSESITTITNTKITGNRAADTTTTQGGGLYAGGKSCILAESTEVSGNYASWGGGIYFYKDNLYVNDCKIYDNGRSQSSDGGEKLTSLGGGIYIQTWQGGVAEINGAEIYNNQSQSGGGIYVKNMSGNLLKVTGKVTNNTAQYGGGIYLTKDAKGLELGQDSVVCNNIASSHSDDIYVGKANIILNLVDASGMGQKLTSDGLDITGWYIDGPKVKDRWAYVPGNSKYYVEYKTLAGKTTKEIGLKAAHGPSYSVTYDANGGTGTVTDSSKYAENETVQVLDGKDLSKENNYFIGWNTKADGSGTSYKAGDKFTMPGNDVTLYAQWLPWKTTGELPGDMYVDESDSTKVVERQQGTTVDITGQIEVTSIQTQLNTIATALGADSDGKLYGQDIPVSINEFGFTATMTLPKGLTLPEKLGKDSVKSSIGDFIVTDVSMNGQTATITFGADTQNVTTFAQLKALVKSAADKGWISVTIPDVKVDGDATVGYLTATGTVTGTFKATAGGEVQIGGHKVTLPSKDFDFTWEAKQDEPQRDSYTKVADIQATVKVTAATPVTVMNDPPVSKTVTGNPSTAATFTFTLTPDNDSYPLPQKEGKDSAEITITGSGTAEFGDITFTEPGTYTYRVRETKGNAARYTYDTTEYIVTYVVTNNNGQLECNRTIKNTEGTESERCNFTNRYSRPSTPDTPSTPTDGGGNDGGGDDGGSTTPTTPTTPIQQITEMGNQIADTVQDVIQQITEFGNEGEQVTEITESGDVSATGDDSQMMVYGAAAGVAAIVLAVWFALRKRNHI